MSRTLEIIFRHARQLLLLLMVPTLIGLVVAAIVLPTTYQAKATLWALRIYRTDTSSPSSTSQATPAGTQATALSELLQTRAFMASVAVAAGVGSNTSSNLASPSDAQLSDLSQHIQVTAQGTNLMNITYSNRNPRMAQKVVQAVIQEYSQFTVSLGGSSPSIPASAVFSVLDAPTVPSKPESLVKRLLGGAALGLAVAILAAILYVVTLVRRDHAVYSSQDVQKVVGLPVIMQVPTLSPAVVSFSVNLVNSDARAAGSLDGGNVIG